MANKKHLSIMKQGNEAWNLWRANNPDIKPGTIMENPAVRELLVTHKSENDSFKALNFRGAYLKGANLRNKDFRDTDLCNADLSGADITGIKLYGASRDEWKIDDIICDYLYLDEKGEERYPKEKNFTPGKFEELYQNIAAINENLIERFIEFPPEYHQAGISILNYFGSVLRKKYPDIKAKIKIEQDGLKVTMIIDPIEGDREVIEKALDDYGLVVTGRMTPEEFTDDKLLSIELRSKLRSAHDEIEMRKELLNDKSTQIDKLLSLVGQGIQSYPDITINNIIGESMGNDTININAEGDVAFAKAERV